MKSLSNKNGSFPKLSGSQRFPVVLNANVNCFVRGGSDRYFFFLSDVLRKHGHAVIPFAARQKNDESTPWASFFPRAIDLNSSNFSNVLQFLFSLPARKAIKRLINYSRPDIAHFNIYYGQLTAAIIKPLKDAGIPIVQTLHDYRLVCPVASLVSNGRICQDCEGHKFWRAIFKKCNRRSFLRSILSVVEVYFSQIFGSRDRVDHFIAPSEFSRKKHIELGIPAEKISVIPNFIDSANLNKESRNLGEYFLYFGRIEKNKGIFTLLEAFADIQHVPLLIVGAGESFEEVQKLIKQKSLRHIQLLGFRQGKELERLIEKSICTLIPSECYETFGLTILESFVYSRPVIGSRIGGIPEVITDKVDGFLVDPGNAHQLKEKVLWLVENPREAIKMGAAGREKTERLFNSEVYYQKLMGVYQKVLNHHL